MNQFPYMNNNAMQMDILARKRAEIDNQMNLIQAQQSQQAPIQQFFGTPQTPIQNGTIPNNFDFNGKWVNGPDEAKQVANNNLPVIIMDKSESKFYIKGTDGSFSTFRFEQEIEEPKPEPVSILEQRMEKMESSLAMILNAIQSPSNQPDINTSKDGKSSLDKPNDTSMNDSANKKGSK